jgi:hypothetical protein
VTDLQDLLDRRARLIQPLPDALAQVTGRVRKRHRRRQAVAEATALLVLAAALTAIAVARPSPGPARRVPLAAELLGTEQALALRSQLGIEGPTKGAPGSVIVSSRTATGQADLSVVHVRTGESVHLRLEPHTTDAVVSPKGDVVAAVSDHGIVVAGRKERRRPAVIPRTEGADGRVSWDGTGSVLFTRVKGQWLRVTNPTGARGLRGTTPMVEQVSVPSIPGGPILVSVSPGGGMAALFGITYPKDAPPVPHLYLGRFDGGAVTEPRRIEIPASALEGPMGWVGDNAFLLAPEPGKALVVRTDGSRLEVTPDGIDDPCRATSSQNPCTSDGPRLLGTNADGSLLFWKIAAEPTDHPSAPPILVLYYKTWLDGTHGVRLGGLVGRLGPPVAPR